MAEYAQRTLPLVLKSPPLDLPGYQLSLLWHERTDGDLTQRWLREEMIHAIQDADAT